ncbi:NAD(P)-dependent alcohol dehydrogenase [Silvibacterium acidisoli]|uniref:NAD(P)-dependent alcohol dehydrogenase n=1 Tax=Acidobacteriaceae bacterium ZG23-2 TaxID=2883246 RepID=UPI00406C2125
MIATKGYAAQNATTDPALWSFEHREPGPNDILIDIHFCGICHSDIHQARNEWGNALYPMVPGHEIVGTVARVGSAVTKFKVGDKAGVGCMVDSCRVCPSCKAGEEQYCDKGATVWTYNSKTDAGLTFGGYSDKIVLDESFALHIPDNLNLAATAPLLCAGITTYSPLRHFGAGEGKRIGIVGLGGLGHMALKFSHAFGAHTVQFTTSASKIEDAKKLGADEVILTKEAGWDANLGRTFDFVLDCVSAPHDITPYLGLLKRDAVYCSVGIPETPIQVAAFAVAMGRKHVTGSAIGGIKETQEMLDFCGKHNIVSDIEMTTFDKLSEAWVRVVKADVKYRFVLDTKSL